MLLLAWRRGGLQAPVLLDVALDMEEDEAYVLGFVVLVALHVEQLLLVVLGKLLSLAHVLGDCIRQQL